MTDSEIFKIVRKKLGLKQLDMAQKLGFSQGSISDIERGKIGISIKMANKIKSVFKINIEDYRSKYQYKGLSSSFEEAAYPYQKAQDYTVPYFNIDLDEFIESKTKPSFYLRLPNFSDCDVAFNISGDSMYPKLKNGDIILCKKIEKKNVFKYGEVYVLLTTSEYNLRTVRIIRKSKEDGALTLQAINENYDDILVPKEHIQSLYLVKGKISRTSM